MDLNIASGTTLLSADQTVVLANTEVASDRAKVIMGNSHLRKTTGREERSHKRRYFSSKILVSPYCQGERTALHA